MKKNIRKEVDRSIKECYNIIIFGKIEMGSAEEQPIEG